MIKYLDLLLLYGMDEFVDKLPSNLQRFDFDTRNREKLPAMPLPKRLFTDFPKLRVFTYRRNIRRYTTGNRAITEFAIFINTR